MVTSSSVIHVVFQPLCDPVLVTIAEEPVASLRMPDKRVTVN